MSIPEHFTRPDGSKAGTTTRAQMAEQQRAFGTVVGTAAGGSSPLDVQVGGGHYKGKAIQPVEYISANNLNFLEGCIVKRITRWRDKNGIEDLQKIKH